MDDISLSLFNRAFRRTNVIAKKEISQRLPFLRKEETNNLLRLWKKNGLVIIQNHGWRIVKRDSSLLK